LNLFLAPAGTKPESSRLRVRAFRRPAQIDPKLPGIHLSLAQIYLQQGRSGEARQQAEEELTIVPESVAARAFLARIPSGEGKQ
jgi:hypothetical protein